VCSKEAGKRSRRRRCEGEDEKVEFKEKRRFLFVSSSHSSTTVVLR
jgi:hypothetical protein